MTRASEMAQAQLADLGICFLFAAHHHPAMKRIMPIRKALGRRTIFNLMGPLANPARVRRQLIGIARPAYVAVYAERSEEHTSELQSLMRISYAVFCLKKKKYTDKSQQMNHTHNTRIKHKEQ